MKPPKRLPIVGVLAPRQSVVLAIKPAMTADEQPTLFTPRVESLRIQEAHLDHVVAVNHADEPVPFALVVVPKKIVKLAGLPWRELFTDLQQAAREGRMIDRLAQLMTAGRPPRES